MSKMVPEVAHAIEEIRLTFEKCAVEAEADGSGGAFVMVKGIALGSPYTLAEVWIGCQSSRESPILNGEYGLNLTVFLD